MPAPSGVSPLPADMLIAVTVDFNDLGIIVHAVRSAGHEVTRRSHPVVRSYFVVGIVWAVDVVSFIVQQSATPSIVVPVSVAVHLRVPAKAAVVAVAIPESVRGWVRIRVEGARVLLSARREANDEDLRVGHGGSFVERPRQAAHVSQLAVCRVPRVEECAQTAVVLNS